MEELELVSCLECDGTGEIDNEKCDTCSGSGLVSETKCDLCGKDVNPCFSLCDTCDESVLKWHEPTDTYLMKDGSSFSFAPSSGTYERMNNQ